MKQLNLVRSLVFTLGLLVLCYSCSIFTPMDLKTDAIDYEQKVITYQEYLDAEMSFRAPTNVYIYDNTGALVERQENIYTEAQAGYGLVLTRTNIYHYDSTSGAEFLDQFFTYEYIVDSWTEFDADDEPYTAKAYLVSRGTTWKATSIVDGIADQKLSWYDVTYPVDNDPLLFPNQARKYLTIKDYIRVAGVDVQTAAQESDYRIVQTYSIGPYTVNYMDYTYEKYYTAVREYDQSGANSTGWSALQLKKEFASYYNADGLWTHELFHSIRGSTLSEGDIYLTKYEWNLDGKIYAQQDYVYTDPALPLRTLGDYSFETTQVPGTYVPLLAQIGRLQESVFFDYDDLGNIIKRTSTLNGKVFDTRTYTYNVQNEQLSYARYLDSKPYPEERTVSRYTDELKDGISYRVTETFRYYDAGSNPALNVTTGLPKTEFGTEIERFIRSNHER